MFGLSETEPMEISPQRVDDEHMERYYMEIEQARLRQDVGALINLYKRPEARNLTKGQLQSDYINICQRSMYDTFSRNIDNSELPGLILHLKSTAPYDF